MTQRARANVEYTIATHAAEKIPLTREAISLCERIADGQITGDAAVADILRRYGVERRPSNAWIGAQFLSKI